MELGRDDKETESPRKSGVLLIAGAPLNAVLTAPLSGDGKFGAVLSSSAHLEPLESRSAACLMPCHLQSLYSCLPPCSASVSFQASIHSTKPVSTCYVPGAVPSAGHQQGFHNTWWPPGARWAHPTGASSPVCLLALPRPGIILPLHSPPMPPRSPPFGERNYFLIIVIMVT